LKNNKIKDDIVNARAQIKKWKRMNQMESYNVEKKKEEMQERKEWEGLKLSKQTILERTKEWLTNDEIYFQSPISYIYSRFSEQEKALLMKEKNFCKQISKIVTDIKKFPLDNDITKIPSFYVNEDLESQKKSAEIFLYGPKKFTDENEMRQKIFQEEERQRELINKTRKQGIILSSPNNNGSIVNSSSIVNSFRINSSNGSSIPINPIPINSNPILNPNLNPNVSSIITSTRNNLFDYDDYFNSLTNHNYLNGSQTPILSGGDKKKINNHNKTRKKKN
jgi:hypothetical protein